MSDTNEMALENHKTLLKEYLQMWLLLLPLETNHIFNLRILIPITVLNILIKSILETNKCLHIASEILIHKILGDHVYQYCAYWYQWVS